MTAAWSTEGFVRMTHKNVKKKTASAAKSRYPLEHKTVQNQPAPFDSRIRKAADIVFSS